MAALHLASVANGFTASRDRFSTVLAHLRASRNRYAWLKVIITERYAIDPRHGRRATERTRFDLLRFWLIGHLFYFLALLQ